MDGLGVYDRLSIVAFSSAASTCSGIPEMIFVTSANQVLFHACIDQLGAGMYPITLFFSK